jgi:hypothetical protein
MSLHDRGWSHKCTARDDRAGVDSRLEEEFIT